MLRSPQSVAPYPALVLAVALGVAMGVLVSLLPPAAFTAARIAPYTTTPAPALARLSAQPRVPGSARPYRLVARTSPFSALASDRAPVTSQLTLTSSPVATFLAAVACAGAGLYLGRRAVSLFASSGEMAAVLNIPQNSDTVVPVPAGPKNVVQQAQDAALKAHAAGVRLQRHEWLVPLIGATDLDDWPGGVRQQFKAIMPMMEQFLTGLKETKGLEGPLSAAILDAADAVGCWKGDKMAAVVFPTAETLPELKRLAKTDKLVMLVNPQWQGGQVIPDFGWGPWQTMNQEFVETFEWVYYCRQTRINGDMLTIQRAYPGKWQVHLLDDQGNRPCVSLEDTKPTYQRLEAICRAIPGSMTNMPIADRLVGEFKFNAKSLDQFKK